MFGYIWYSQGIIQAWRPGFWYLTNKRLFLWREEMLFETPLDRIEALSIRTETRLNMERSEIALYLEGDILYHHANNGVKFKEAVRNGKNT
ncbi:MAG: hypothetical protein Q8O41_06435 [Candidatus Methanoperedens sp.]|nr:hypothetical protein [Candidatus Methanoperedens sp.]